MLKEIIAETIVKKAKILSKKDPKNEKCFVKCTDDSNRTYYKIPESLSSLGIVVASNNNAAVENISLELPQNIDESLTDKFIVQENDDIYFTDMSDELLGNDKGSSWGLISAKLGKSANISNLNKMLNPYFKPNSDDKDLTKLALHYKNSPKCWDEAKKNFEIALNKVEQYKKEICNDYNKVETLEILNNKIPFLNEQQQKKKEKLLNCDKQLKLLKDNMTFFDKILYYLHIGQQSKKIRTLAKEQNTINCEYEKLNNEINKIQCEINKLNSTKPYIDDIKKKYGKKGENFADSDFYYSCNITENEDAQSACPWTNEEYDALREELFYYSLQLQKCFILSSEQIKKNIELLNKFWNGNITSEKSKIEMFPHLFATLSLLVPVVSTTFASVSRFLKYIGKEEMGILIVDEAGQATPQSAVGALWRCKSAIIVGDPLQVEPICTIPKKLIDILSKKNDIQDKKYHKYKDITLSVQELTDNTNEFFGEIGNIRVGCPLVVHRRCIDPMFKISNTISYNGRMINKTVKPKNDVIKSKWIDISGKEEGNKNHYVSEQGSYVLKFLEKFSAKQKDFLKFGQKELYIISPFNSVVDKLQSEIFKQFKNDKNLKKECDNYRATSGEKTTDDTLIKREWLKNFVGTVHKFQGKEAKVVLFVLGCDSTSGLGAAKWAGSKANILNVAVTRAKQTIVIIGDKNLWKDIPYFKNAVSILDSQ